jgi:pimeloyl-ACP methyl ester carboxylesterase
MNPVLLLHGALGSKSQLEPIRELLTSKGFTVYSMNFSGHSGEAFHEDFGIEIFAEDIFTFLEKHNLKKIDIFGYSMGGYVALWLAYHHPEKVGKVVTLGTKFDWSVDSALKETQKLNPDKIIEKVPAFARILETRHAPHDWRVLLNRTSEMMMKLGHQPLLNEAIVKKIDQPTLIMLGDLDDMADLNYSKLIAQALPNGKFILLTNTHHPIERVHRDELITLLISHF